MDLKAVKVKKFRMLNRDISWLSLSHRILQEAADLRVPLYERIKFIAIFSSILDEFFRVRVAAIKSLANLKRKTKKKLDFDPAELLARIKKIVEVQQPRFEKIFASRIVRELNHHNIFLVRESELREQQRRFAREYFKKSVEPLFQPVFVAKNKAAPFLENKALYLAIKLRVKNHLRPGKKEKKNSDVYKHAIVEIPTAALSRFVVLPEVDGKCSIMFLDDIVRLFLSEIFSSYGVVSAYSIKLTRDAELYIEDEFSGNLLEKIKKGLSRRKTGIPTRFLYDQEMPKKFLKLLRKTFSLKEEDLVGGGRYHNYSDFFAFPNPKAPALCEEPLRTLRHRELDSFPSLFETIAKKDFLLHYPYQTFEYVLEFLRAAAIDPNVTSINITLYRVAQNSQVIKELVEAARRGKTVTAFVEVKARFDEESNFHWAEELEKAGVKVIYSFPGLKVHAKLCLVSRKEPSGVKTYAYLSTGNFNEETARAYADYGFFTSDPRLTREVAQVFDYLSGGSKKVRYEHLLVAPFNMREAFLGLVGNEIRNRKRGKKAQIIVKMNGLEDPDMIRKLYEASWAKVNVQMIVRGICCLIPGVKKMSRNIEAISIVDRFLEHGRVYIFHNGGKEKYYLSSADWMVRNLSRRIEVAFPIYDEAIQRELKACMNFQLSDNVKAREIDKNQKNKYKDGPLHRSVRAQTETYVFLKQSHEKVHRLVSSL